MTVSLAFRRIALSLMLALIPLTAGATTLIRQSADGLAANNELVVLGQVVDLHSYWNAGHDFILTDVRILPSRVLKGSAEGEIVFTVMGGTIDDVSIVVVGGADLVPGSDYVLFLHPMDLPGAAERLTVREHAQGVFDVVGDRAFSQALGLGLAPDAEGDTVPPGGEEGMPIEEIVRLVREHAGRR
jgi:hypothetical protein